ncbi:DoxX family membrane protein [Streptomyces sp. NPDC004959]|uniref:DoxX family membrane protein n=1 Tax=unclassified Streptomyces TaxID=2593676 RepID=UPI0004C7E940|nr:DoxX family membrane protein [Streptomyces sp. NRRL F-5630]
MTSGTPLLPSGPGGGVGNLPDGGLRTRLGRYSLLPLRVFLGVTFVYAGIDKLTDSAFLSSSGNGSLGDLLRSVKGSAGVPALVDLALHSPVGFGYALAIGELLVGLGTLLGVFGRVAALGGAAISLCLWLTVSWSATPYYYGNDLVYLMAWLPLLLAGTPYFSFDSFRSGRRRAVFRNGGFGNTWKR